MSTAVPNGWNVPPAPHNSLGPSDPAWLAKLSAHLGIAPAHTLAPLVHSIWPDTDAESLCCRESCALLMQSGSGVMSRTALEDKVQRLLSKRTSARHPAAGVWAALQADPHFVTGTSAGTEDSVRLDKGAIPAPAVASLYMADGTGVGMLGAEKALHHAAVHLTWPHAMTDDDAYLCCFISELLLSADEQTSDRQLPRHSMHLTEVGGALRQRSDSDGRLATIFPKGQVGRTKRPRLSEFLCKDELKPFFSVQESRVRQSEKVVTLRTDVLLRALGPLAGLMQKAFASTVPKPAEAVYTEQAWSGSDSNAAAMSVGTSLTPLLEGDFRTPAPALPDQIEGCTTPAVSGGGGHPAHAHSLFHGVNLAAEVPESIRNCWSDAGGSPLVAGGRAATPAIAIPSHPTPDKLRPGLASELGRIGDHAPQHGANPQAPSTMVSFTSEDVSDALGLAGGSWHRPPTDDAVSMQRTTSHVNGASRGLGGDSVVNSPSLGSQFGSMWGGHSMWSGGVIMDSAQHDPVVDSLGARVPSSQAFSEHSHSHMTATWAAPAPPPPSNGSVPITPGSAVSSFSSRPFAPSSAPPGAGANYAAVLRATASATPGASVSTVATPSPLQAPPSRHMVVADTDSSDGPSPDENRSVAHTAILAQLDPAGRELFGLLWPPWTDHVLALAHKSLTKPGAAVRSGSARADVNQAFLAAINACVASKAPLAGLLDRASAHARKQAMLVSGAAAHPLASNSPSLVSLKPQVRKEVNALLEQHRGVLHPEHFDSGVICHLQRRSEAAAAAALREIGRRTDFSAANNKPAYLTHWLMKLASPDDPGRGAASAAALRVSSQQPDLRKLTRATAAAIEKLVDSSPWIEWRHFDAGVMKVLQQLAASSEADALAEVRQVEVSELSSVKNMPAYLNKCFNNRLWKVRY